MKKFAVAIVILLAGCASLISGSTQPIMLNSQPAGAKAQVDGTTVFTPATIHLERKNNHTVIFSQTGYETQQVKITKSMNGWVLANILLGGIPGIVIDLITGAAAKLEPDSITVTLTPSKT